MALFDLDPTGLPVDELIEELGASLAARYATIEEILLAAAAKRAYRILDLEQRGAEAANDVARQRALRDAELARVAALSELRGVVADELARIRREDLAAEIIQVASTAGQAAAAAQLQPLGRRTAIPASSGNAVGALELDLRSKLTVLNQRITRFPNDVYQQVMSIYSPRIILGVATTQQAQRAAVQSFLSQGIGSINYLHKDGSVHLRMPIGSYAEMVGRTSSQRAWQDAATHRMQQSGISLGTISGGVDACARCAPWIGRIVSLDGTTGTVYVAHSTRDEQVAVRIDGTIDQARASGWGHPNCRDRIVAYAPGLTVTQDPIEFDPAAEKERADQRKLEREIRAAKRDAAIAPDEVSRRRAEKKVAEKQAEMREFIARTGRARRSYREQVSFSHGTTN